MLQIASIYFWYLFINLFHLINSETQTEDQQPVARCSNLLQMGHKDLLTSSSSYLNVTRSDPSFIGYLKCCDPLRHDKWEHESPSEPSKPHERRTAVHSEQHRQTPIQFSSCYNGPGLEPDLAFGVSFIVELISWRLSLHIGSVFVLDGDPAWITGGLRRSDHPAGGCYATDRTTLCQHTEGFSSLTSETKEEVFASQGCKKKYLLINNRARDGRVSRKGVRFFVLKAVADESAGRQSERASTAGSAKPCLSPSLSTQHFGVYICPVELRVHRRATHSTLPASTSSSPHFHSQSTLKRTSQSKCYKTNGFILLKCCNSAHDHD